MAPDSFTLAFPGGALRVDSDDHRPLARLRHLYRALPAAGDAPNRPDLCLERGGRDGRFHLRAGDAPRGPALPLAEVVQAAERALHELVVERAGERLVLHSAAVERDGSALLLPARSGSGKTTLAGALAAAGCGYLGDELAILDATARRAFPFAKALSLKPGSLPLFAHFDRSLAAGGAPAVSYLDPERLRTGCTVTAPRPVGGLLLPRHAAGAGMQVEALSAGETLMALVESAVGLPHRGDRQGKVAAFGRLADLAERVRGFRLTYGDAFTAARRLLEDDPWAAA